MDNIEKKDIVKDIEKCDYYGGVIETAQGFVYAYKSAVEKDSECLSIEYLQSLADTIISHAEDILNSFELGREYLEKNQR